MAGSNLLSRTWNRVSNWIPGFQSRAGQIRVLNDFFQWQQYTSGQFPAPSNQDFLGIPAVLAAIRLTAETVAGFPLPLYKRGADDSREKATNHPAWDLWKIPNSSQTEIEVRSELIVNSLVDGVAYGLMDRDEAGNATAIYPFPIGSVTQSKEKPWLYECRKPDGELVSIPEENLFILNSFLGRGLAELCATSFELSRAAEKYAAQMFLNGCRPGGLLIHPKPLSPEARERLRREFEAVHKGVDNAGRVMVAAEGMQWVETGGVASDAQAVEQRRFQVEEVCRIFGVPPSKMGLTESTDIEKENAAWLQTSIIPICRRFEQQASKKCLLPLDRDKYYWEHNFNSLMRADTLNRAKYFAVARNWGWMSVNDVRTLEGLNKVDGGDQYLSPVNMSPLVPDLGSPGARAPGNESPVEDSELGLLPPQVGDPAAPTTTPGAGTPGAGSSSAPAAAAAGADVQSTALNGAQIASLLEVVSQVATGLIPVESAKAIALASFPTLPTLVIDSIFDPVRVQKTNAATVAVPQRGPGQSVQQPGE